MAAKRSTLRGWRTWVERFRRVRAAWAAVAVTLTGAVFLVYLNLSSAERRIEHTIPHRYATGDSQFVRSMGNLLGPGFVAGNRVTSLLNGDEVFPAMLQAIRSAR